MTVKDLTIDELKEIISETIEKEVAKQTDTLHRTIKELKDSNQSKWVDVNGAANYLSCSPSKIRQLVREGYIVPKRLGSNQNALLRFSKKQLDLFMVTGKSNGFTKQDKKQADYY